MMSNKNQEDQRQKLEMLIINIMLNNRNKGKWNN